MSTCWKGCLVWWVKMKNSNRYNVSADEDFEPNSNNEVLKNYLGIKSKKEIEALEEHELERAELELFELFDEMHQFTARNRREL
jgi:hypothetical protein